MEPHQQNALLALIADLYGQLNALGAENKQLREAAAKAAEGESDR